MPDGREPNKPSTVLYAQACMYTALLSAFVMTWPHISDTVKELNLGAAGVLLSTILIFGPLCYLIFEIGRGKNRARIAYLVLTVAALAAGLLNVLHSPAFLPGSPLFMVVAIPNIVALTLLYRAEVSVWFKKSKESPVARAVQAEDFEKTVSTYGITEQMRWSLEPLFVLKYRRSARLVLMVVMLFIIVFFAHFALVTIPRSADSKFHKVFEIFLIALVWPAAVYFFCDQLMVREIRLYKDRIVQVWWLLGSYELLLRNARLRVLPGHRGKVISLRDRNLPRFTGLFKIVCYYDQLPDPKDVRRLNGLLAELSGRQIAEFEQYSAIMDPLIRKEKE